MKKFFRFFILAMAMITVLSVTALAFEGEKEYIYVNSETGIDSRDSGSVDMPVKTFTYALNLANFRKVNGELVVVFQNQYTFVKTAVEVSHPNYSVTLTAFDGITDYRENGAKVIFLQNLRYMLNGTTSFENLDITYSGTLNFTAQYNPITFGEGLTMTRTDSDLSGIYVVGGYQAPDDSVDVTKDSHITIKSGTFRHVCGGTRDKLDGVSGSLYQILKFEGTHYIDVSGGYIENLYGGSLKTHYSQNAVINMSGGEVLNFNVSGDMSRRLNGNATVTLSGGKIGTLNVNNVIGTAEINLCGTNVEKATVWCYNDEVSKLEKAANLPAILKYDANYYTSAQIDTLGAEFDVVENTAKVYAKAGATGSGESEDNPASFADAFAKAADLGSTVYVLGTIDLGSFTEPAHTEKVSVTGDKLVAENYVLNGDTEFFDIELGGIGFVSEKACISTGDGVETDGQVTVSANAELHSGKFAKISNANAVIINGASVDTVTDCASVELISGEIGTLKTAENAIDSFVLNISGGTVKELVINNVAKSLELIVTGGKIEKATKSGTNAKGELSVDENTFDVKQLDSVIDLFTVSTERVVYVKNGGTGNGSTVNNALGSIHDALRTLSKGGVIVICGEYSLASAVIDIAHEGKITITSVYDGVDYRKTNNARMNFTFNYYCSGDTEFNNITLDAACSYPSIYANGNNLVLGDGIECGLYAGITTRLSVMGGSRSPYTDDESSVVINSGTWQRVRGGTTVNGSENYTAKLTINGGTFIERVTLGSSDSHDGDLIAEINGGEFRQGIYAATLSANGVYSGNATLTINGGTFYHIIGANASTSGTFNGSFNVVINGGEFAHLVELKGTEGLIGNASSTIVSTVDLSAKEVGTYTFTSPIRNDGADPWLFYHDGYYYYTSTTGSSETRLVRATNFGDLIYYGGTSIYKPEAGKPWSNSTWSPTLLHYTDEEVGKGNGGWYFYFGGAGEDNTKSNATHRMYVLKCLDGDNILGRWGNPITGELNHPQAVTAPDIENFDTKWAAGQGDIRIDGKVYVLYVTDELAGTRDHYQTINILPMTNPWTFEGQSSVICYPTESWEMGGHRTNNVTGETTPKTVECASPLYAEDGTVFITYSGSNYTSKEYCVAYLKYLGGDPMDINSWEKCKAPIVSQSEFVSGTGSACNIVDTAGQGWLIYNAYEGKDTSGARHAMIEPYTADKNGIVVGDGSGKAAIGGTVYTAALNPMPMLDKISGFDKVDYEDNPFDVTRAYDGRFTDVTENSWFYSYVKNAYELSLANGTSATKFSPDNTFTVAQALTAAANIHTAYHGKTVRAAAQGEAWYVPYVEYCTQNGIIKDGQFKDVNANITRGDMAIVFANILPDSEYKATKDGSNPDVTSDMACYSAVAKLFKAGIVGGDAGTGNYRPNDSIKRSEACVIFTRIAMKDARA